MQFLEFTGKVEKRTKTGVRRHPGVMWDWKVTLPPSHGGKIKDLQTIFGIRERTQRLAADTTETVRQIWRVKGRPLVSLPGDGPPRGYWVVDSSAMEDPGEPRYGGEFPIDVNAGKSTREITGQDSPDQMLNSVLGVRQFIHETFKYFILFKPNREGAIWVPVGKIEWFWRGEAVRDGKRWRLQKAAGGVSVPGAPTTEFPEYDDHSGELKYLEIDPDDSG